MGAGKSSVGRVLAEQLGWTFEDLDERIERRERRKVPEIFRDSGESGFRQSEHAALKELLRELRTGTQRIVALGGGAFAHKDNATLVKAGRVPTVFLDAAVEELWRRCRQQAEQQTERPLLGSLKGFAELYQARRRQYMKASFRQETGGKTVQEIAAEVVQGLGLGPRSLGARSKDRRR
jgi:shikimate kinase